MKILVAMVICIGLTSPAAGQGKKYSELTDAEKAAVDAEGEKAFLEQLSRQTKLKTLQKRVPANQMLELIVSSPDSFERLGLIEYQQEQFSKLREKYLKELTEIFGEMVVRDRLDWAKFDKLDKSNSDEKRDKYWDIKQECQAAVLEIFLDEQLKKLENTGLRFSGLSKIVTRSPIGDMIELTDVQKESIQKKSNELAREIEEFVTEARQRSADIVLKTLTKRQREQLYQIYGEDYIRKFISTRQAMGVFADNAYRDQRPGESHGIPPKLSTLRITEVNLPGDKKK